MTCPDCEFENCICLDEEEGNICLDEEENNIFPIDPFGSNQVLLEGQRFVCPKCELMFYIPPKISKDVKCCPFCGVHFDN